MKAFRAIFMQGGHEHEKQQNNTIVRAVYCSVLYNSLLLSERLYLHLLEIDRAANDQMEQLMPVLMKTAGVTEELKARNPMRWVGLANNCKAQAEEIILYEFIYQQKEY